MITTEGNFSKLFAEGLKADFMKEYVKFDPPHLQGITRLDGTMKGAMYDTIIVDDVKEAVTEYAKRNYKLGFTITKKMVMDDLYANYPKKQSEEPMYIDPTKLSKKELINLVMNMQGLIEVLVEENKILEEDVKIFNKQANDHWKNKQAADLAKKSEIVGMTTVIEHILDRLVKQSID